MHPPISPSDLVILLTEADAAAARLGRRLGLPPTDKDDLRQELLADLIRRLPAFDPARGALGAFIGVVLRNHAARIAGRLIRERRAQGGSLLSIDATADGTSLADALTEHDGLAGLHGRPATAWLANLRIDLTAALARLDGRDRWFCAALAHSSVDQLADRGFGSRAGIYRRLRELRCQLTAYGLEAA